MRTRCYSVGSYEIAPSGTYASHTAEASPRAVKPRCYTHFPPRAISIADGQKISISPTIQSVDPTLRIAIALVCIPAGFYKAGARCAPYNLEIEGFAIALLI